jgi:putative hydrolase
MSMGIDKRAIDWDTAQRVGELLAGSPPYGGVLGRSVQPLAHDFARRVSAYTGLELPAELPPLEMIDRPSWIAANLHTMQPLLDPLIERLGGKDESRTEAAGERGSAQGSDSTDEDREQTGGEQGDNGGLGGLLAGPLRAASGSLSAAPGHLLGAQLGAVTGMLSQRVLGQYDVSLLDATAPPRLLLLAPNLAAAARNLGVDRDELIAWVAIHEITHAVQFSGAPWLREHLGGILRELLDGLQVTPSSGLPDPRALLDRARDGELRALLDRARHGELLRITLGEDRWQLVERMQSTMSLIEGHAEHTMDAVGAEVLPSLPRLRTAMTHRRESRGLLWQVLERLLGLELKMRQYEVGRRFCDAVVDAGGPETLAVAWRSPQELPTAAELAEPALWLERIRVPA